MAARALIAVFTVFGLLLPVLAGAQTGTVRDGVKVGKAYISGENPAIRLFDKPGGILLTYVSFWRVVWSPVGAGHVCYVTTGDGKSAGDLRIAIVDNQKLFEYLTHQILGSFNRPYLDQPFTVVQGTFKSSGDALKEWKEVCRSAQYTVELTWGDFSEPFQLDIPTGGAQNPFGITSLIIPAKTAEVMINGTPAAGHVYPQMRGSTQTSSAFLAFSESWVK